MFKQGLKGVLLLAGMFASASAGEDFVLRTEEVLYEAVDQDHLKRMATSLVRLDKSEGVAVESLEIRVKSGKSFYAQAMGRQKAVEVHGKFEPSVELGQFELDVNVTFTTYTGLLIPQAQGPPVELTEATTLQTTVGLTVGKPQALGGITTSERTQGDAPGARKHECRCIFLTLEAVKREEQRTTASRANPTGGVASLRLGFGSWDLAAKRFLVIPVASKSSHPVPRPCRLIEGGPSRAPVSGH